MTTRPAPQALGTSYIFGSYFSPVGLVGVFDVFNRLQILFIDDDPDIAFIMGQAFGRDPNIDARHAGCGTAALKILQEGLWRPDCILVDYKLPDVTGATVLAQIRNLPDFEDVPSIFITANPSATIGARSALGSLGTISKPFSITTLVDDIRALLPRSLH